MQGKYIPSNDYIEQYINTRSVVSRSIQQEATRIGYGTKQFPTFPVDRQSVYRWSLSLIQEPNEALGKPYSRETAKSILNHLGKYYQYLLDMGHLDPNLTNPFNNIKLPSIHKSKHSQLSNKRKAWNQEQIQDLISNCADKGDYELLQIILLACHTGARIEELASIEVDNIHLSSGTPYFSITKSKSEAGYRDVPVHPYILPLLDTMKKEASNKYLFSNLKETSHNERSSAISKRFGRLKKKLGYSSHLVFHSFRHTATTLLEQAGVEENIAMDILGHEKPNITFGHYSGGTSMEQKATAISKAFKYSFQNKPIKYFFTQ